MKKKGFTLIELLAVIVILAIIALIVTPVVSNIILSARKAANARSVEGHIKNIEYAIIEKAFEQGNGDLTIFDSYTNDSDLKNELTLPDSDKILCVSFKIEDGIVISASGCKENDWPSDNVFNYTLGVGAYAFDVIDSCPGCVYAFPSDIWYYTGSNPTVIDSSSYKANYKDVVSESGKNYFLGLRLNKDTNTINKLYACAVKDGEPFCVQGATDDRYYEDNQNVIFQDKIFGPNGCYIDPEYTSCSSSVTVAIGKDGDVYTLDGGYCRIYHDGYVSCF